MLNHHPPGGPPPAEIRQNDFVSDEDFEKMVASGSFGGIQRDNQRK